jgi:hypothetical protein
MEPECLYRGVRQGAFFFGTQGTRCQRAPHPFFITPERQARGGIGACRGDGMMFAGAAYILQCTRYRKRRSNNCSICATTRSPKTRWPLRSPTHNLYGNYSVLTIFRRDGYERRAHRGTVGTLTKIAKVSCVCEVAFDGGAYSVRCVDRGEPCKSCA